MKVAILGAGGRLGAALLREYREKYNVAGFDRAQLDLASSDHVRQTLNDLKEREIGNSWRSHV